MLGADFIEHFTRGTRAAVGNIVQTLPNVLSDVGESIDSAQSLKCFGVRYDWLAFDRRHNFVICGFKHKTLKSYGSPAINIAFTSPRSAGRYFSTTFQTIS